MVRKGGSARATAYGLAVATTVRTPLEDLGPSLGAALAARANLRAVSFELRLGLGRARQESSHFSSTTWDLSASVAALRLFDVGADGRRGPASRLSWGLGLEAGVARLSQQLDTGEARASWNPFVGPVALAELTVARRYFLAPRSACRSTRCACRRVTARRRSGAGAGLGAGRGASF